MRASIQLAVSALIFGLAAGSARADVAPALEEARLIDDASAALDAFVASRSSAEQQRVAGVYVAIDPSETDVLALPGCDDDGDYVVVLSRALLDLVASVAAADARDRMYGTHQVGDYGELLARAQRSDARPLPIPAARPTTEPSGALEAAVASEIAHQILTWIVVGELAHALRRDFTCPNPTVTHEHADDEWTSRERALSLALAPQATARLPGADACATTYAATQGMSNASAHAWLTALAPLEETRAPAERPTYLTFHPHTRARLAALTGHASTPGSSACESAASDAGIR